MSDQHPPPPPPPPSATFQPVTAEAVATETVVTETVLTETVLTTGSEGTVGVDASDATPFRNVSSEFFATVMLMLAGPGLIVLGEGRIDTLAVALSFGAALAIAIGVIGAVANPALSLALVVVKEITPRELVEDWIGQFAGALVGAALIWGINDQTRSTIGSTGWDVGGFSELGSVIAAELVFTIVLVVVFLSTISRGFGAGAIAAYTGLASVIGHLVLIGISGGGMNPARSVGSAIFSDTDPNALGQVGVFIVVPLVAAIAAVFVWLAIDDADVDDTMFDETVIDRLGDRLDGTVD